MEKVDILLATYNGEKYLKEQLDSILNQTYTNFNLIICDDLSTDSTIDILKEYEKKDTRIKVILNEENLGYVKNFEKLLRQVTSDIYMLCDQDDVWNNDKVEVSLNKLINTGSDLVFTDLEIVDEKLNTICSSFNREKRLIHKINRLSDYRLVYLYNTITGCTVISKSKYIEKILPMCLDTKQVIHDWWIALVVLLNNGKITYLDVSTIKYRQHTKNQVGSKRYTDKFNKFDEVRQHFISVKLDVFNVYLNNDLYFTEEQKLLNKKAIKYFELVKNKRYLNLSNISTFHKLYKYESISNYLLQFVILNIPCIARIIFKFKK